jgi:hypothetical protein
MLSSPELISEDRIFFREASITQFAERLLHDKSYLSVGRKAWQLRERKNLRADSEKDLIILEAGSCIQRVMIKSRNWDYLYNSPSLTVER